MQPTPEEFEALVRWSDGFPRPDWRQLWDQYCGGSDARGERFDTDAERAVQRLWLTSLARHLGGGYRMRESRRLFLMSEDDDARASERLAHLESIVDAIIDALEGIGPPDSALPGKLAVLYFTEDDDYYAYIADYYPPEGQFGMSCGICLRRDELHVAINGAADASAAYARPRARARVPVASHAADVA